MNVLIYLFKTVLVSGLLFSYYWLFLRNKQFHRYNRFYLLGLVGISLVLPLLNIPVPFLNNRNTAATKILQVLSVSDWEEAVTVTPNNNHWMLLFSWQNVAGIVYAIVCCVMAFMLIRSVKYVISVSKKYDCEKIDDINLYHTHEPAAPFSFFRNIFWNKALDIQSEAGTQIFRHELYHVRKKHSLDILLLEIVHCIFWFNPFYYLLKKEMKAIHEFLADEYAASGSDKYGYAELLLWQTVSAKPVNMIHPFFHNHIKRRITMITQFKITRYGYISRLMALPVFFMLFCAFAIKLTTGNKPGALSVFNKTITVVIDAGHGGTDNGTRNNNGTLEKNINLSISKKIQELSKDYNVNVVMTRESDILPGNAKTIKEGLENRIDIATAHRGDLMISIHTNADITQPGSRHGFEIYVSTKNPFYAKSVELGSALTETIKKTSAILPDLQQREKGVQVLQSTPMPTVMIECGYITNTEDFAFISDEKNQEKIARDILEGVVKYRDNSSQALTINKGDSAIVKSSEKEFEGKLNEPQKDKSNLKDTSYPKTFTKVEIEAEYPGGREGWSRYLNKNVNYPQEAVNKEIQGTVLLQFIIDTAGKTSDITVLKSPSKLLSDEGIRIIKESGNWIPAREKGHVVRCYKKQPINFILEVQTKVKA